MVLCGGAGRFITGTRISRLIVSASEISLSVYVKVTDRQGVQGGIHCLELN